MLVPLAALAVKASHGGWHHFWQVAWNPESKAALELTLGLAAAVVAINAVTGTMLAWTLVRDDFRGKVFVNTLIDLPFALPTIVAGLTLLALYGPTGGVGVDVAYTRWGVLMALLFVTLPFVVRTVQPVLIELDREMEEAAASLGAGRVHDLQADHLPAPPAGAPLGRRTRLCACDRRVRCGHSHRRQPSVQDGGRVPVRVPADQQRRHDRRGCARDAAARDLARVLLAIGALRRWATDMTVRHGIRVTSLAYLAVILVAPVGLIFWRAFEHGWHPFWAAISSPDAVFALKLTVEIAVVAVPLNTIFGVLCALAIVRHRIPGMGLVNAIVDLPMALSPVVVGLSLYLLYGRDGWFGGWLARSRGQGALRISGHAACDHLRVVAVRRARGRACLARDRDGAGGSGGDTRLVRVHDLPAHHAACDPVGRRLRRRVDDGALARRVRRRRDRSAETSPARLRH